MFEYLEGLLVAITEEYATLDLSGIGYKMQVPYSTVISPPTLRCKVRFYITEVIREDSHRLFGFLTLQERSLFETLIDLPQIGPKIALHLVGRIAYQELYQALKSKNIPLLSKIPGIGKKTAERLALELPSKLPPPEENQKAVPQTRTDVLSALAGLGFNLTAAQKAIEEVLETLSEEPPLPQFITLALQKLR